MAMSGSNWGLLFEYYKEQLGNQVCGSGDQQAQEIQQWQLLNNCWSEFDFSMLKPLIIERSHGQRREGKKKQQKRQMSSEMPYSS